jgi:hypothetical protein
MLNYVFDKMPQLGKLVVTVLIMFASSLWRIIMFLVDVRKKKYDLSFIRT